MPDWEDMIHDLRWLTMGLGIFFTLVGLHSYYWSPWLELVDVSINKERQWRFSADDESFRPLLEHVAKGNCPLTVTESSFVAITTLCYLLVVCMGIKKLLWRPYEYTDIFCHGSAAMLTFAAGLMYIDSASEIEDLVYSRYPREFRGYVAGILGHRMQLGKTEKIVAGVLTIIQSLLYGVMTFFEAQRIGLGIGRGLLVLLVILFNVVAIFSKLTSHYTEQCSH